MHNVMKCYRYFYTILIYRFVIKMHKCYDSELDHSLGNNYLRKYKYIL